MLHTAIKTTTSISTTTATRRKRDIRAAFTTSKFRYWSSTIRLPDSTFRQDPSWVSGSPSPTRGKRLSIFSNRQKRSSGLSSAWDMSSISADLSTPRYNPGAHPLDTRSRKRVRGTQHQYLRGVSALSVTIGIHVKKAKFCRTISLPGKATSPLGSRRKSIEHQAHVRPHGREIEQRRQMRIAKQHKSQLSHIDIKVALGAFNPTARPITYPISTLIPGQQRVGHPHHRLPQRVIPAPPPTGATAHRQCASYPCAAKARPTRRAAVTTVIGLPGKSCPDLVQSGLTSSTIYGQKLFDPRAIVVWYSKSQSRQLADLVGHRYHLAPIEAIVATNYLKVVPLVQQTAGALPQQTVEKAIEFVHRGGYPVIAGGDKPMGCRIVALPPEEDRRISLRGVVVVQPGLGRNQGR